MSTSKFRRSFCLNKAATRPKNIQEPDKTNKTPPQRSASVKNRLPFSYIKTSTIGASKQSNATSSIKMPDVPSSPKLLDDNFFLYANNSNLVRANKQENENVFEGNSCPSQASNQQEKRIHSSVGGFHRSTFKTSSFHTYRRYVRYFCNLDLDRIIIETLKRFVPKNKNMLSKMGKKKQQPIYCAA